MLQCCGVRLSCIGFRCDASLFSALRSTDFCLNIHRDESPFFSHTLWMKLCLPGQQRRLKGPGPVVGLFVYRALEYGTKYKTYQVGQYSVCGSSSRACKLEFSDGEWSGMKITGNAINNSKSAAYFYNTSTIFFFFFVLKHIIQHENSNKVFEEGEEDMRDLHRVVSCCGFHFYISPWTHTRALVIVYISPCRDSWSESWCEIRRREGVLIYDNSYNMPPVMHYHPHQTTTKREGLKAGGRAITRTTQRAIILTT